MNSFEQYEDYDALGLAEILRKGEVTPTEVLEAAIDRADKVNPDLNAIILDLHKMANRTISKGLPEGILLGVPYLIKDLGATLAGTPTTGGSRFMKDVVPDQDSETVKRLIAAGLGIFGKSNTFPSDLMLLLPNRIDNIIILCLLLLGIIISLINLSRYHVRS